MTRQEFINQQLQQADQLRTAILADTTASPALYTLAADKSTWDKMYLASLEESGLLLPDGTAPPIRTIRRSSASRRRWRSAFWPARRASRFSRPAT